jgi:hypothetical protein
VTGADVRLVRQMQREDADPSKWPVRGAFRRFMQDCHVCKKVRGTEAAITAHLRRVHGITLRLDYCAGG